MIEQAGPPSKQIQATKQVQEFLRDGDDVIIIGVFSGENDKTYQLYQEAGKECFKILMKYLFVWDSGQDFGHGEIIYFCS